MTTAYILPDTDQSLIVVFDQTQSEGHEATAEVTEHPVEQGSNIADHVRQNPIGLTLEMFVTNTPIEDIGRGSIVSKELTIPRYSPPRQFTPGSLFNILGAAIRDTIAGGPQTFNAQVLEFPEPFDRVKEVHEQLLELWRAGASMSVVTSTRTYDEMVITSLSLPRTEPGGGTFTINFKQVRTVTTASVTAPAPAEKRGTPAVKKGSQATKPVNGQDSSKAKSLAFKALEALGLN